MSYFRKRNADVLLRLFSRHDKWLICLNADPDALASAMALKRIMARRTEAADIAIVNEIKRPDNLTMVRFLRIPFTRLTPELAAGYDRFAVLDSQPHHHPDLAGRDYDIVIDHHPPSDENPVAAPFQRIEPTYGANATIMTEFLYSMRIRPGKLLATALSYGIKTDTRSFERHFIDADIKAFSYLNKYASKPLMRKIVSSEFKKSWLKYFSKAFRKMRFVGKNGLFVYMGALESPDILVILADFFTRVHGLSWVMVCGVHKNKAVCVFRGDGLSRDMGRLAADAFGDLGPAGGHKAMARAEMDMQRVDGGAEAFLYKRFTGKNLPAGACFQGR